LKFKSLLWRTLAALTLFYFNPAIAATSAGVIELVEGHVVITRADNITLAPMVGDSVEEGDTIITGADGELHITMADSGFLAVRPNTRLKIEHYRADGDNDDKSEISLIEGTFRSITGWIGKYSPRNYRVITPTATLGIRGTDHEPLYIPEGASGAEGEPGMYDKVNQGETFIQNPRGKVFIKADHAGFVPYSGRAAPKLLPRIPNFFRATRNEQEIDRRREILKPQIDKRRLERRQHVRQQRTAERRRFTDGGKKQNQTKQRRKEFEKDKR